MIRQLKQVCKSYLCRKMFWPLAVLYVIFTCVDASLPSRDTPLLWQQTQVRWMPHKSFDGMTAFLNWQATDDELQQLQALTLTGYLVVPSDKLGSNGKPTLTLEDDAIAASAHLAKLAKCTRLRELTWLDVEMTPEIGQTLAKLPHLQQLKLSLIGTPNPSLEALPTLANLRFFQVPMVPPSELGLLAKHPLLTTVELQDSVPLEPLPGELNRGQFEIWQEASTLQEAKQIERVMIKQMNEHTQAVMGGTRNSEVPANATQRGVPISSTLRSAVAELPNLTAVEVHDSRGSWPPTMIDDPGMRQALASRRDVVLNPVALNVESLLSLFAGLNTAIVLVVIGFQLFAQFGANWSRTVPGFARSHLFVAAVLLVAHLLISSIILTLCRNVDFLPALSIAAAMPAVSVLIVALLLKRPTLFFLVIPFGFFGLIAMTIGSQFLFRAGVEESYLDGRQSELTLAILFVEVVAILWAGRSVLPLSHRFNEAGVPVGLGVFQTMRQLQMQRLKPLAQSPTRTVWGLRQFDRRLDSYLSGNRFKNRMQQWRAIEPTGWRAVLWMCLVGPWLIVGVNFLTMSLLSRQVISLASYAHYSVLLGGFSLTFGTLIIAVSCHARRPVLGQELLRPVRREDMLKLLRTSMWIDLWPALLLTLGYLIALPFIRSWGPAASSSVSWGSPLLSQVLLCFTLPIPVWGGTLLLLTISSTFWRTLLIALGCILLFGGIQPFVKFVATSPAWQVDSTTSSVALATYGLAGVCLVVGIALGYWAIRRLPQVEWGN